MDPDSAVIIDTRRSCWATLRTVPIKSIQLEHGFWKSRLDVNLEVTIPTQYALLESTGRLDNFRRVVHQLAKPFQGYVFNDSDVYKWLEAASWAAKIDACSDLRDKVDQVIALVSAVQTGDGYLNTYFSMEREGERWTNLQEKHELYCAGHLIQAAIAHHRTTGEDSLLMVAIKLADHLYATFGPSGREGTCGHPEVEMALVELFRTTRDARYFELARLFIERRGHGILGGKTYLIDHVPFDKLMYLAGHAVRALYLCAGVTDIVLESGDQQLRLVLERLWSTMVHQQMYITGGLGARHDGEAFGEPYELPNARAYAETCAAIASVMWSWRMLLLTGDASYADLLEWTLFNAVLPGISLDGRSYFYVNPLQDSGFTRRQAWFDCACCPPNVSRTLAMLPGYIYSLTDSGVWIHLFTSSNVILNLVNGERLVLRQVTSYPWEGKVIVEIIDVSPPQNAVIDSSMSEPFSIFLRIPGWLRDDQAEIRINDQPYRHQIHSSTYLEIHRSWQKGDRLEIIFPMPVVFNVSHPMLMENAGRIAISRGPLVYCLESADNPRVYLPDVSVDPTSKVESSYFPEPLGEVVGLRLQGRVNLTEDRWMDHLYQPFSSSRTHSKLSGIEVACIPYFTWANRTPGAMQVWLKVFE